MCDEALIALYDPAVRAPCYELHAEVCTEVHNAIQTFLSLCGYPPLTEPAHLYCFPSVPIKPLDFVPYCKEDVTLLWHVKELDSIMHPRFVQLAKPTEWFSVFFVVRQGCWSVVLNFGTAVQWQSKCNVFADTAATSRHITLVSRAYDAVYRVVAETDLAKSPYVRMASFASRGEALACCAAAVANEHLFAGIIMPMIVLVVFKTPFSRILMWELGVEFEVKTVPDTSMTVHVRKE